LAPAPTPRCARDESHLLYGVVLRSPLRLPGASAIPNGRPDVRLCPAGKARFDSIRTRLGAGASRSWFFHQRLTDGHTYLRWAGLFEFLVSPDGRQVHYHRLGRATRESFLLYLLGQVLSFPLLTLGREPLHGTVVAAKGKAVAMVGDCGFGKSTIAAAMLARGCRLLTDDLVVVERKRPGWIVHPGVPRLKLFPAVADRLLGARGGTPMNDGTSKLVLPLGRRQWAQRPLPLAGIYVLSHPQGQAGANEIAVDELSGGEALRELIAAAFNVIVLDRARLANQFEFASRLVRDVPVRRLTYPRTFTRLPAVCDRLLTELGAPGS
jgi:hypothetical protein